MGSTFGSLEIAKSGMLTYNSALQTTAHNIANIETEGYSKQVTNTSAMVSTSSSLIVQGSGVNVDSVTRQRNEYYDNKYQSTNATYHKYDTDTYYLDALQDALCGGISSDNTKLITDSFDDFYASLSNLLENPNDDAMRTKTATLATTFTEYVNNIGNSLQKLQEEANMEIESTVEQINAFADKLASINNQIATIEAYRGVVANDLRDQRNLLLDQLSEYASIETMEKEPANGVGGNQFYVYVNGHLLVDANKANHIEVYQKDTYTNINDEKGLYALRWEDGTTFNPYGSGLGGKLQSLFEFRDGNNSTVLSGTAASLDNLPPEQGGNLVLTVEDANINDLLRLNIPSHDGELLINNTTYPYKSFEVSVGADGKYTYQFVLQSTTAHTLANSLNTAISRGYTVSAGAQVDNKGVPYYMAQLNEFVRTFAQEFNRIQNDGYDLHDKKGVDFFNGTVPATGDNYVMFEADLNDPTKSSFSSVVEKNSDGTYIGSYYHMNALNFSVTKEIIDDPRKIACKQKNDEREKVGNDNGDNLKKLVALKDDSDMFVHGAPDAFLQSLTATLGVNAQKAKTLSQSQNNLLYTIDNYRQSVSSVDEDEEANDLVVYQNLLNYQYKVLSVLNEVIDRLINQTGV